MGFWSIVAIIAVVLLLIDIAIRLTFMRLVAPMIEKEPGFNIEPAGSNDRGEAITFQNEDGLALCASLYRPEQQPRGMVMFCPEFGGNHWQAMQYAEALVNAGFAVFAFDFRNQGGSESTEGYVPLHWATEYEVRDLNSAIDFIRSRDEFAGLPMGIYGISRGGIAALAVAARRSEIQHVACQSIPPMATVLLFFARRWAELFMPRWLAGRLPEWHLRSTLKLARGFSQRRRGVPYVVIEQESSKLRVKKSLIITGKRDSYVKPDIIRDFSALIGPACEVWIVPKAKHNVAQLTVPDEYNERLVRFFDALSPVTV